jgi:hypothetical protein
MFKKLAAIIVVLALVAIAAYSYAASPALPIYNVPGGGQKSIDHPGETDFTSIGAWGFDNTGNPGFIVLKGVSTATSVPYYLWVDGQGKLRMASYPMLMNYSSFPTGNWTPATLSGTAGVIVGQQ